MCTKREAEDRLFVWGKFLNNQQDSKNPLGFSSNGKMTVDALSGVSGGVREANYSERMPAQVALTNGVVGALSEDQRAYAHFLFKNDFKFYNRDRVILAIELICKKTKMSARQYNKFCTLFWKDVRREVSDALIKAKLTH